MKVAKNETQMADVEVRPRTVSKTIDIYDKKTMGNSPKLRGYDCRS